ncbi:MAG: 3-hydroxyacyl-CoA dehydrogenase NAD-binding domain-containing protein, partial [Thermovirgaceae bacterium]|nr:3-hydroxyacyl-CoA dehydrogenase NAD-binding domain-containing protein [Thermovirgaceae bacterium]
MRKVMVYGTGTMGTGITQVMATAGVEVLLGDALGGMDLPVKCKARVGSLLDRAVQKGKETAGNAKSIMDRIHPVADMA